MIDLSGKSAVVTGGSRGIGRAIALRLAAQGADVAFSYRGNEAAAKETAAGIEGLGRKALAVQADVSDPESADALIKAALEAFGKVDILVNNAGITRDDLIMRMSVEAWRSVLETNLFGAFYAIKAVTRPMLKAKGGRIVNISSVSGQAGQTGQANYSAAKAGLQGFTKTLAIELGPFGITANAVAPGFIVTDMTASTAARVGMGFEDFQAAAAGQIPVRRVGQPDDVANTISFLASEGAGFVSGQVIYVAGGPLC
jgi:3-oxoacyl-[acyl-carrier protein] reductase